jgi:MFS family permease
MVAALELGALVLVLTGRDPARAAAPLTAAGSRLVPPGAVRPSILIALAAYGEGVITALLVLHLVDNGVHAGAGFGGAASVFTVFAVSVIVFRVLAAPILDRLRPERIATAGFAAEAAGLAVMAVASSFGAAALGATLMGAGFAVLFPALAVVATGASSEAEQGAALGAFGAAFGLGLFLGSLLSGAISSLVGTTGAHLAAAGLTAGAGVYLVSRRERLTARAADAQPT